MTNYAYFKDNQLQQVSYTNATVATPTVNFTYDPNYSRVATMADGVGTTTYVYNPIPVTPTLGAGRLASIDGPFANDTITYSYDELGRTLTRAIDGANNTTALAYDALGRVTGITNPLGAFTSAYVNATDRLDHMLYPNGQRTNYSYFNNVGDQRLQSISNLSTLSSNLSTFTYTYDAEGVIQNWSRQFDTGAALNSGFQYDAADQLTGATVPGTAASTEYIYRYDVAGNRTSEQIDNGVSAATVNNLNQTRTLSASGPIRFAGSLDEGGTVKINGQNAPVAADHSFQADVNLPPGNNTVAVVAKDTANNITTKSYTVPVASGTSRTLMYDLNGSMTNNGAGQTYDWDAANRLVKITQTSGVTEFVYDGVGRRVKEKLNGGIIKQWVWCGEAQPCEERDATNAVTKRFYVGLGEQIGGNVYFYNTDHLGSVREMTDSAGVVRARYDYDPYGRTTKVSGDLEADLGFTGFYRNQASGLNLTLHRQYDAVLGRWLSRDPIGENRSGNLYGYVSNDPINYVDPTGLVGIGVTGAVNAEAGFRNWGAAATGAAGIGLFYDKNIPFGDLPINAGGWLAHGEMARWGDHIAQHPKKCDLDQPQDPKVYGIDAGGIGEGVYITNANNVGELAGPFRQWNVNTPWGSASFGKSGDTWIFSITVGPSVGGGYSAYPTTTKAL